MVRYLGVTAPSAAQVYRDDILPKLQTLPQPVRDTAMLLMLHHLPDLQQQHRTFAQLLARTPFLPSGKGTLHAPGELYDPRSPELVALLDPDACFPAPAFCGDVSEPGQDEQQEQRAGGGGGSFSSLAVLQQLGLRCAAQLDTLVLAARYVEKVAADGDADMAVARGKVGSEYFRLNGGQPRMLHVVQVLQGGSDVLFALSAGASICDNAEQKCRDIAPCVLPHPHMRAAVCFVLLCRRCLRSSTQSLSGWWAATLPSPALQQLPWQQPAATAGAAAPAATPPRWTQAPRVAAGSAPTGLARVSFGPCSGA